MLSHGVDVPTVSAVLGHARTSTTVDIYWHTLPGRVSAATEAIERALRAAGGAAMGGPVAGDGAAQLGRTLGHTTPDGSHWARL